VQKGRVPEPVAPATKDEFSQSAGDQHPKEFRNYYNLYLTGKGTGVFAFAELFKQPSRHA